MKFLWILLLGKIWSYSTRLSSRVAKLNALAKTFWEAHGEIFDEEKYWDYGCHCTFGLHNGMAVTSGPPKDWIDRACKSYKACNLCVKSKHGSACQSELITYEWKWSNADFGIEVVDPAGSCPRELGECDKQLVAEIFRNKDDYNKEVHLPL